MFASFYRLTRLTLFILLVILVITFSVSNRDDVLLSLYPLPFEINLPLYLFFLITLIAGYSWGALSNGFNALKHKRQASKQAGKLDALEQEVSALRTKEAVHSTQSLKIENDSR